MAAVSSTARSKEQCVIEKITKAPRNAGLFLFSIPMIRRASPSARMARQSPNQVQLRSCIRHGCGSRGCRRRRGSGGRGRCRSARCIVRVIATRNHARKLLRKIPILLRPLHQLRGFLVVAAAVIIDHLLSPCLKPFGSAGELVGEAQETLGVELLALRLLAVVAAATLSVAGFVRNLAGITAASRGRGCCWSCRSRGCGGGCRRRWSGWGCGSCGRRFWSGRRHAGLSDRVRLRDRAHAARVQRVEERREMKRGLRLKTAKS